MTDQNTNKILIKYIRYFRTPPLCVKSKTQVKREFNIFGGKLKTLFLVFSWDSQTKQYFFQCPQDALQLKKVGILACTRKLIFTLLWDVAYWLYARRKYNKREGIRKHYKKIKNAIEQNSPVVFPSRALFLHSNSKQYP